MFTKLLAAGLAELPRDTPAAKRSIERVEAILRQPFHPDASPEQLGKFCLAEIERITSQEPPADPRVVSIYWDALRSVCRRDAISKENQKRAFELAVRLESPYLFYDQKETVGIFTDEELWGILDQAKGESFRRAIWSVLLQRDLKMKVVQKLKSENPPERKHILNRMLPQSYSKPGAYISKGEQAMWLAEFKANPITIAYELKCYLDRMPSQEPAFKGLANPAREFWRDEIRRSLTSKTDFPIEGRFHKWVGFLAFLDRIDPEFDTDLWQQLAQHRGYTVKKFSRRGDGARFDIVEHHYHVREKAKQMLKDHGHQIKVDLPDKVVISSKTIKR